jgi:hypothetical protein
VIEFTSNSLRGQKEGSPRRPPINSNRGDLKLPATIGRHPTTPSAADEGWARLAYTITPPQREHSSHSRALDVSPSNFTDAAFHDLSSNLRGRGKTQQTKGELSEEQHWVNAWTLIDDENTTKSGRRKFITQFTFLYRFGFTQESCAERRRLLTTIIDHFMYEVILWNIWESAILELTAPSTEWVLLRDL